MLQKLQLKNEPSEIQIPNGKGQKKIEKRVTLVVKLNLLCILTNINMSVMKNTKKIHLAVTLIN